MGQVSTLTARLGVVGGKTALLESHTTAPLKIARPFPQSDGSVEICIMDASPGILDGDSYKLDWHLDAGASARVTTQGFTRVHPCPKDEASLITHIVLGAGSQFVYVPEATQLYKDARLNASTQVELARDARLILLEAQSAGRTARGEVWHFQQLRNRLVVCDEEGVLACQQTEIVPKQCAPTLLSNWGSYTHSALLWFFQPDATHEQLSGLVTAAREQLPPTFEGKCAASRLARGGVCAMLAAQSSWDVQQLAHEIIKRWLHSIN